MKTTLVVHWTAGIAATATVGRCAIIWEKTLSHVLKIVFRSSVVTAPVNQTKPASHAEKIALSLVGIVSAGTTRTTSRVPRIAASAAMATAWSNAYLRLRRVVQRTALANQTVGICSAVPTDVEGFAAHAPAAGRNVWRASVFSLPAKTKIAARTGAVAIVEYARHVVRSASTVSAHLRHALDRTVGLTAVTASVGSVPAAAWNVSRGTAYWQNARPMSVVRTAVVAVVGSVLYQRSVSMDLASFACRVMAVVERAVVDNIL